MTEIKFPKWRDDHSFVLFARFTVTDPGAVVLVQDYVQAWARANRTWTRVWRSDIVREERLEFDADFLSVPHVEVGPGESAFSVVLEGRPGAKWWKDWAVFLVSDIAKVFPEVKFERFES